MCTISELTALAFWRRCRGDLNLTHQPIVTNGSPRAGRCGGLSRVTGLRHSGVSAVDTDPGDMRDSRGAGGSSSVTAQLASYVLRVRLPSPPMGPPRRAPYYTYFARGGGARGGGPRAFTVLLDSSRSRFSLPISRQDAQPPFMVVVRSSTLLSSQSRSFSSRGDALEVCMQIWSNCLPYFSRWPSILPSRTCTSLPL